MSRHEVRSLPRRSWFATPGYAAYDVAGGAFPVGENPLRVNSPGDLSAKPGFLAVCIAPHRYLSGPALSPQECILLTRRPKGSSPAWTVEGTFHPFHRRASWRTNQTLSPSTTIRSLHLPALRLRPQPQGTWRMLERINQQSLMWPSSLWTLVYITRTLYHGTVGSYPAACWVEVTRSPSTHAGGSDAVL
jgi:hypothetical protein